MKSAIAILTFRRLGALQTTLDGILKHVPEDVPVAIFEDCANFDDTVGFLTERATTLGRDDELEATVYRWSADRAGTREVTVFIGQRNVGVAGNSNKAIRWFERQEGYDHLLLCNDDLIAAGDFAAAYGQAHEALKIGLFCFCPVKLGEEYVGPVVKVLGHQVRMVPRMTGPMMSMTRAVVKRIGYYDVSFGRAGEEHCVAGSTPLISLQGLINIEDAVDKEITIWNGLAWKTVIPRVTGTDRTLVRIHLGDGSHLDCTPDHGFSAFLTQANGKLKHGLQEVDAITLTRWHRCEATLPADAGVGTHCALAYTYGVLYGDGCLNNGEVIVDLVPHKQRCPVVGRRHGVCVTGTQRVICDAVDANFFMRLRSDVQAFRELFAWDRHSILEFVAGLADTDGNQCGRAIRIAISGKTRAQILQLLLLYAGIRSSIGLMQEKGAVTNFGPRSDDVWLVYIPDCRTIPCYRLITGGGRPATRKGKFQTIRRVEVLPGTHTTYCFTEYESHKGLFGTVLTYQCDYTNRSRFAGFINLRGKTQHCLDIVTSTLDYNYGVHSSIAMQEKKLFDKYAARAMERAAPLYQTLSWYRPFRLLHASNAGAYGGVGIPVRMLEECGYTLVVDHDLKDALMATI